VKGRPTETSSDRSGTLANELGDVVNGVDISALGSQSTSELVAKDGSLHNPTAEMPSQNLQR
jgi:hypothetical protein